MPSRLFSICKICIIATCCCCMYGMSFAQHKHLVFHKLDQSNGLSELTNIYHSQSSDQYLWISSFDGLNRFDGKNVKVYRPALPDGKVEASISSQAFEDKEKNIWFTTIGAIHRLDQRKDSITSYTLQSGTTGKPCVNHYAFHLDQQACLWIVADGNLHRFNTRTLTDSILHPFESYLCYPILDKKGRVKGLVKPLMDSPPGIEVVEYHINQPVKRTKYFTASDSLGLPPASVFFLHVENDTTIWLPSTYGLIRFNPLNPAAYKVYRHNAVQARYSYCDADTWRDSFLWVSSMSQGVFLFDKKQGKFLQQDSFLQVGNNLLDFRRVNNLLVDANENLWLASWEKGLAFTSLRNQKFSYLLRPKSSFPLKNRVISQIMEGPDGNLWCIVQEEGVFILDKEGRELNFIPRSQFENDRPMYVYKDWEGDIWLLTLSRIFIRDRKTGKFRKVADKARELGQIVQISKSRFLVLSLYGLFSIEKTIKNPPTVWEKSLLNLSGYHQFFLDKKNQLFLSDGTDKLFAYRPTENGLDSIAVLDGIGYLNSMAESMDGISLWFASSKGLLKVNALNLNYEFIHDKEGLLSRSLNAILQDRTGNLWISSNNGILKFSPKDGKTKNFTESDGLQGLQFVLGSGCHLSSGKMCFGGVNGMNLFDPAKITDNPNRPIVHFTNIVINDNDTLKGQSPDYLEFIELPFSKRTLTIHYTATEYSAPLENSFKYHLIGYDQDTVFAGTYGSARYSNLPKGDYIFQVFSANSDGVWGPAKELKIKILPHWTDTWWFKSLVAICILALLYGFYRFRISQIRKEEEFKRKEAEFRQKEAEIRQQMAETETAILRLQMNPHFIFNSMNSIYSYIINKDIDTASDYLNRFAKLMRMILKLAAQPYIFVSEEIELLRLYLQTEAMRFGHNFSYTFEVDEAIDPDETILPTMILQPFVENAIWHGIARKPDTGRIVIRFKKEQESLLCCVEDNGIGREAASKLKEKSAAHESQALSITSRRLELLAKEKETKSYFNIEDLKNPDGSAAGTKVSLIIPLL